MYSDTWIFIEKLSIIQQSMISKYPWYPSIQVSVTHIPINGIQLSKYSWYLSIHGIQVSGYPKKVISTHPYLIMMSFYWSISFVISPCSKIVTLLVSSIGYFDVSKETWMTTFAKSCVEIDQKFLKSIQFEIHLAIHSIGRFSFRLHLSKPGHNGVKNFWF